MKHYLFLILEVELFLILEVELNRYCFQVGENVLNYQVDRYARTKGIDPERMTADQRESMCFSITYDYSFQHSAVLNYGQMD